MRSEGLDDAARGAASGMPEGMGDAGRRRRRVTRALLRAKVDAFSRERVVAYGEDLAEDFAAMPWRGMEGGMGIAQFGEVWVDFLRHDARRAEETVTLTALQFKVLKFLFAHPYRVISREELLKHVWGYHDYPATRTVDNQIMHLRRKLEAVPANPVHFRTIHRAGYKFVP